MGNNAFFRCEGWHDGPECQRVFVSGTGGVGVKICCLPCGTVADVEGLGGRETLQRSRLTVRELLEAPGAIVEILR